jgi:hypothetical protein
MRSVGYLARLSGRGAERAPSAHEAVALWRRRKGKKGPGDTNAPPAVSDAIASASTRRAATLSPTSCRAARAMVRRRSSVLHKGFSNEELVECLSSSDIDVPECTRPLDCLPGQKFLGSASALRSCGATRRMGACPGSALHASVCPERLFADSLYRTYYAI